MKKILLSLQCQFRIFTPVLYFWNLIQTVYAVAVSVFLKVRKAVERRVALLRPDETRPFHLEFSRYFQTLNAEQRGAVNVKALEAVFVGVILLVVLITFMLQQGLPMILSASSNTTALEDAGATTTQTGWVTFIGGAIFIFFLVGLLIWGIRTAMPSTGGGGGGGRRWRWRRRK